MIEAAQKGMMITILSTGILFNSPQMASASIQMPPMVISA
jgi:hypothetical protein